MVPSVPSDSLPAGGIIEPVEHRFVETIGLRLKFVPTHEETDAVESEPGDPHEVFGDFARIEVAPHRRRADARPIVNRLERLKLEALGANAQ